MRMVEDKQNNGIIKNIISVVSVITILCLMYISLFNVYQTDDYIYATSTQRLGILGSSIDTYLYWGGRFFSYTVNTMIPLAYSNSPIFPKIYPIFLMGTFLFSLFLNFRLYFKENNYKSIVNSVVFLFIYCILLSLIDEHIFWFSGANIYFLPHIILSFFLYFFGKYNQTKENTFLVISVLLSILIAGSNEITAISFTTGLCCYYYLSEDKKKLKYLLIITILALGFSFLAPGNYLRKGDNNTPFFKDIIKMGGYFVVNSILVLLKSSIVIPIIIFYFEKELYVLRRKITFKKGLRIVTVPILVSLLFAGFLKLNIERAIDPIILLCALTVSFMASYYIKINKPVLITCLLLLFIPKMTLYPKKTIYFNLNYNLNNIYKEIFITDLYSFNKEMAERQHTLETSKSENVVLKPIKNVPKILHFYELGTQKKPSLANYKLQRFYHKKFVGIEED